MLANLQPVMRCSWKGELLQTDKTSREASMTLSDSSFSQEINRSFLTVLDYIRLALVRAHKPQDESA